MENLIFKKIPKIMSLVGVVWKDRKNEQQGYKFRGIDDMYNALNKHLSDEGVFCTSEVLKDEREERLTKNGWLLMYSILTMKFTFFAEDGSSVSSTTIGEAMDTGDKSMNKAMSTAYKYALMQIFCIPTEEDKDTENQTHEIAPKNTPIRDDVPQTPKVYPKSALDEVMEQMEVETDIEHLKTLYALGLDRVKSDKQKAFFDSFKEKQKKRILALNVHTA